MKTIRDLLREDAIRDGVDPDIIPSPPRPRRKRRGPHGYDGKGHTQEEYDIAVQAELDQLEQY